jgi:hypothetical protein
MSRDDTATYTPQQSFARDVLTAAIDGGSTYWARVGTYRSDGPPDQVLAVGVDLEDDRSLWQANLDDIQAALDKVADRPGECGFGTLARRWRVRLPDLLHSIRTQLASGAYPHEIYDTSQIDAADADLILQVAVGEQVMYG